VSSRNGCVIAAAFAWLLMEPPHRQVTVGSVWFDATAPLEKWERHASYETEQACRTNLTRSRRLGGLDAQDDSWSKFYAAAQCIPADAVPRPARR
jgi:hypothetical protein